VRGPELPEVAGGAADQPVTLVVILTVRAAALEAFRAFERGAAAVIGRHGGAIERTVVIPPEGGVDGTLREVHIVTFPGQRTLDAYRSDDALRAIADLREQSVLRTEVLVGEDGPDYAAGR
jgi:antibiotic biosynthesis monooxygenase (ABM) superfamily enzyme